MRLRFASTALAGLLAMTGCSSIVSLQPFVMDKDATTDPGLAGTWLDSEGKDTFVIQPDGDGYKVTYVEKSGTGYKFDAKLWKIGDTLLLDLVNTNEAPFQLPVHFAMRVWVERDSLRMAFYDTDWLKKKISEQLISQKVGDRTVITATPDEIRAFYLANAKDEKAHGDAETLHRIIQ